MEQTIPETLYYSIFSINIYYIIYIYYTILYTIYINGKGPSSPLIHSSSWPWSSYDLLINYLKIRMIGNAAVLFEARTVISQPFAVAKSKWNLTTKLPDPVYGGIVGCYDPPMDKPFCDRTDPLATGCNGKYESVDVIISVIAIYPFIHTHKCRKPLTSLCPRWLLKVDVTFT